MLSLCVCISYFSLWEEKHPRSFIKPVTSNTLIGIQRTTKFVQKCGSRSNSKRLQFEWTDNMAWLTWPFATHQ